MGWNLARIHSSGMSTRAHSSLFPCSCPCKRPWPDFLQAAKMMAMMHTNSDLLDNAHGRKKVCSEKRHRETPNGIDRGRGARPRMARRDFRVSTRMVVVPEGRSCPEPSLVALSSNSHRGAMSSYSYSSRLAQLDQTRPDLHALPSTLSLMLPD